MNFMSSVHSNSIKHRNIEKGLKVKAFEVENYICWGTPDDYETYNYWKTFFNKCDWHEYCYDKDITYHKTL